ncbi:MAG: type VI secretion system baseplate subunit TssF [Myxococcota bacterium]
MFSRYYQSELSYLKELGEEFAKTNPSLAGLFSTQGGDPDVQRLLEGFAFLTARIRERVDDAVPEIVEDLTRLLLPQYLQTTPACSVVQFYPQRSAIRGAYRVEPGTELSAKTVEGELCTFRTTASVDLTSLEIIDVLLDYSIEHTPALRMRLTVPQSGRDSVLSSHGFRLFFNGPIGVTSQMYLWMNRYLDAVSYIDRENNEHNLNPDCIRPIGLSESLPMLPWPRSTPGGLRLIQEYFTLPAKLLFLQVTDLQSVGHDCDEEFEIIFRFNRPPELPEKVTRQMFCLHCVPVVNLFETQANPISVDVGMNEYLIRATNIDPRHVQVEEVLQVTGESRSSQSRTEYHSLHSFEHMDRSDGIDSFYNVRRRPSVHDDGFDIYLSLQTPRDVAPEYRKETLSIDLTCSNRNLTDKLGIGDISLPTKNSPTVATFSNITEISKPSFPPVGSNLHWKMISHLASSTLGFSDHRSIKSILGLYILNNNQETQRERANRRRVDSIQKLSKKSVSRLMDKSLIRGLRATLELDSKSFVSEGDAFVFGCALHELFVTRTPINSFHETAISLIPRDIEFLWSAQAGGHSCL